MKFSHSSHGILVVENKVYCLSGKSNANVAWAVCEYLDL